MEQEIVDAVISGDPDKLVMVALVVLVILLSQFLLKIAEIWLNQANKRKEYSPSSIATDVQTIKSRVNELHDWHNVSAQNGAKIWYNNPEVEHAIKNNSEELRNLTTVFRDMLSGVKRNTEALERMHADQKQHN